jgi:outer membrane murein-binding lipoprotein Lpp
VVRTPPNPASISNKRQVSIAEEIVKICLVLALAISFLTGCANSSEVDDLRKQVQELKQAQTHRQEEQNAKKEQLTSAIDSAESERLSCQVYAEKKYNDDLHANGTPDPKHKGYYTGNREVFKGMEEAQSAANAQCQREYEDAVQAAKIKFGE